MKVKYYIKWNDLYVLLNGQTGAKRYILPSDLKHYSRDINEEHEFLLVYDTLEEARRAVDMQFIFGRRSSDVPDGLAIEKVTSRFFGLWKKREILSIV